MAEYEGQKTGDADKMTREKDRKPSANKWFHANRSIHSPPAVEPQAATDADPQSLSCSEGLFKEMFKGVPFRSPSSNSTFLKRIAQPCVSTALQKTAYQAYHLDALDSYQKSTQSAPNYNNASLRLSEEPLQGSTMNNHFFGQAGSSPYDRMPRDSANLIYRSDDILLQGTTRLSNHVPGYAGHIPEEEMVRTRFNCIRANSKTPNTHNKALVIENFNVNMPGCTFHVKKI